MDEQLPHNDPDLERARKIEKARKGELSLSESDDPFLQQLQEFKKEKIRHSATGPDHKERVWKNIAAATKPEKETPVTPLFSSSTIKWAAAAVVLIGVVLSLIYIQLQQPQLVASTQQSIKEVTLTDGSNVTLRAHSKLFALSDDAGRQYQLEGEAFFDVAHDPEHTFSVQTESGKISVLGTEFTLSSWGQKMQVYLQEGSVKVQATQQDSGLVLKPGESATIDNQTDIPTAQVANPEEFTDWMSQQIIFENKPARNIVAELEQQFNISITLPDEISQQMLTGSLSLDDRQKAFEYLELVLNGTFIKKDEQHYQFKMQ